MFCEGLHIQISAEAEDVDFGHWGDPETPLLSSGISVSLGIRTDRTGGGPGQDDDGLMVSRFPLV